jgi:N-acetylmuramoyl-L-alanine amidase
MISTRVSLTQRPGLRYGLRRPGAHTPGSPYRRSTKGVEADLTRVPFLHGRWPAHVFWAASAVFVLLGTCSATPGHGVVSGLTAQVPLTPGPVSDANPAPRLTVDALRTGGLGDDGATIPAVRRYTVQRGDTLDAIARQMGLQTLTLVWANPGVEQGLVPGRSLVVPPVDGVLHVVGADESADSIANAYNISRADLLDANGLRSATQVRAGSRLLIPGAKPPAHAPVAGGGEFQYQASDFDHFPQGWCTWYVAQRRPIPWSGDAWSWFASAQGAGWATGKEPRVGAIMVTWESLYYGHVAYVEKVNADGTFEVSEMNYKQFGVVDFRTVNPKKVPLIGFIY